MIGCPIWPLRSRGRKRRRGRRNEGEAGLTGKYFMMGNIACAEGALAAAANSQPATPSRRHGDRQRLAERLPQVGAFSSRWRMRSAPSRPSSGLLDGEEGHDRHLGRGSASCWRTSALPWAWRPLRDRERPARSAHDRDADRRSPADMVQPKRGSHGDYEIIALCPASPRRCSNTPCWPSLGRNLPGARFHPFRRLCRT